MGVTYLYRCHNAIPTERFVRRFDYEDSVPWWFRRRRAAGGYAQQPDPARELEGGFPANFRAFEQAFEREEANDVSLRSLRRIAARTCRCILATPRRSCLQARTDDHGVEMVWYFFSDEYAKENPGESEFLMRADWNLPVDTSVPPAPGEPWHPTIAVPIHQGDQGGQGEGALWMASMTFDRERNYQSVLSWQGVRMQDLPRRLSQATDLRFNELVVLRAALLCDPPEVCDREHFFLAALRADPLDDDLWLVFQDWFEEQYRKRFGQGLLERAVCRAGEFDVLDPLFLAQLRMVVDLDLVSEMIDQAPRRKTIGPPMLQGSEHMVQMAIPIDQCQCTSGLQRRYHQWFAFDDIWANSHSYLAHGILRFATCWDPPTARDTV